MKLSYESWTICNLYILSIFERTCNRKKREKFIISKMKIQISHELYTMRKLFIYLKALAGLVYVCKACESGVHKYSLEYRNKYAHICSKLLIIFLTWRSLGYYYSLLVALIRKFRYVSFYVFLSFSR